MSLINDMLKDLEARRPSHAHAEVQQANTPEPPPFGKPPSALWLSKVTVLQALLAVALATGVAWWVAKLPLDGYSALAPVTAQPPVAIPAPAPLVPAPVEPAVASVAPQLPQVPPGAPLSTVQPLAAEHLALASTPTAVTTVAAVATVTAEAPPAVKAAKPPVAKAPPPSKPLPALSAPATRPPNPMAPVRVAVPAPVPLTAAEDAATKAERIYQQALTEQKQGQTDAALTSLQNALAASARHVNARLTLARLLVERKQAAAAADLLADGLMLLPQQTDFMLALAPLWIQAGQPNDAMALLAQGTRSANNNPAFHAYYASQLLRLKRQQEAITHYRLALRSDPAQHEWLLGLGLALQATGQTSEAVNVFSRALASGKLAPQSKSVVEQLIMKLQEPKS